jgi:4-hydroxybenzoate polyprenyltransferase
MTRRLGRYVADAYPLRFYLPYMLLWAVGLTVLLACLTGVIAHWRPDGWLAVTGITLVLDMLMLRALDDIRDHDYDRAHHPNRPLPAGRVSERDLLVLITACTAVVLLLNAGRWIALAALAVQLGYAFAVIAAERRFHWPAQPQVLLHLAVNLPIQALLSLYVYAGFLSGTGQRPHWSGFAAIAAATLAAACLEFGRKANRAARPEEHTYATVIGPGTTSAVALGCALAGALAILAALRPWSSGQGAWGWLVLVPPLVPVACAVRFARGATRWPTAPTLAFVPATYSTFLVIGLLAKEVAR